MTNISFLLCSLSLSLSKIHQAIILNLRSPIPLHLCRQRTPTLRAGDDGELGSLSVAAVVRKRNEGSVGAGAEASAAAAKEEEVKDEHWALAFVNSVFVVSLDFGGLCFSSSVELGVV